MDEELLRQLTRQLRLLNFWVSFFGIIFLLLFAAGGFFAYKAYQDLHKAQMNLSNLQQKASGTLNVQSELCNSSSISSVLKSESGLCN